MKISDAKNKMNSKKNLFLIIFCLVLVFLIPHVLGYLTLNNYSPCNAQVLTDDCPWYTARARDFYDGNLFVEDHLIYENKNTNVSALPFLDPIIYGMFLILLMPFASINVSFIIIKTIFVVVNFFLLKKLGEKVFKNELFSILFSTIIVTNMLLKEFFLVFFYILSIISTSFTEYLLGFIGRSVNDLVFITPLIFERVPRPNLTFIFLTLSIITLLQVLEKKELKKTTKILYGLTWSTLFYAYLFYYVSFFIAVVFLSFTYYFKNKTVFRNLKHTFLFSLLFSIPYWLNYFNFKNSNFYNDYTLRIGIEQGHFIRFLDSYFIWAAIIFLFFLLRNKIKKEWFYFCLTFFAGAFIGLNIQLITGFNPHPDHWVTKVIEFILVFMFFTILNILLNKLNNLHRKIIISSLIAIILIFAAVWQIRFFEDRKQVLDMPEEEVELYNWLNNLEKISVVLTDEIILNYNIPFYTKHNIFFPQGAFTILKNKEILGRTLKTYALLNYSEEDLRGKFNNKLGKEYSNMREIVESINNGTHERLHQIETHIDILGMKKTEKGLFFKGFEEMNETFSEEDINKLMQEYNKLKGKNTIDLPEKVDYIVTQRNLMNKTSFENLKIDKLFSNNKYKVYKITLNTQHNS